jgi:hypothetical protein
MLTFLPDAGSSVMAAAVAAIARASVSCPLLARHFRTGEGSAAAAANDTAIINAPITFINSQVRDGDHEREEIQQLELDPPRLVPVSRAGAAIEFHHHLRQDSGARQRAAIRTREKAGA